MLNRLETVALLRQTLPGKNLYQLAQDHGVTLSQSKMNKGWVGQTIEKAAGLNISNLQSPDGIDFELKSTRFVEKNGAWQPKETIKVTQLNPEAILEETFETSALWKKLSRLILVSYYSQSETEFYTLGIHSIDVAQPRLVSAIKQFWDDVRDLICSGEFAQHSNLGKVEDYIQLRPVGDGKFYNTDPITGEKFPARAFYATKKFISEISVGNLLQADTLSH